MKCYMKKLVSILIAIIMMAAMTSDMFAGYFSNDIYVPQYSEHIDNNMEISGTNSFGNMLSEAIIDELADQQENAGYNVLSVEITGQIATVELETLRDSTVVIGIYDEPGINLLMTASAPVTPNDEYVTVTFDQFLPQYFYIKAYLVDSTTLRPLCTVYDCPNYTQEMQEFFAKTVYDFDSYRVLNLDSDVTNNFAVYSDSVTVIPQSEGINTLISQGNDMYIFANADGNILGLQPGQIFSYEYAPGEVIIAKVATVTENPDGTVTVTEQDAELDDAFEYIKIDTEAGMDTAEIDNSELEEGVEFVGMTTIEASRQGENCIMPLAFEDEGSHTLAAEYKLDKYKIENEFGENISTEVDISGDFAISLTSKLKYYISLNYSYIEVSIDYEIGLSASISGKVTGKFEFGSFGFSPVPGVYIGITPSFLVEFSIKITLSATICGTVGYRASNKEGAKSIGGKPKIKFDGGLDLSAELFIGLSLEPKLVILNEKIVELKLTAKTGFKIIGKLEIIDVESQPDNKYIHHECNQCIDGDVYWVIEGGFSAQLLNNDKWTFKISGSKEYKILDFYYSIDNSEFGFGNCPNYVFDTFFWALDEHYKFLAGVKIELSNGEVLTTDETGVTERIPLKGGEYTAVCSKEGYRTINRTFVIDLDNINKVCGVYINMQRSKIPMFTISTTFDKSEYAVGDIIATEIIVSNNNYGHTGAVLSVEFSNSLEVCDFARGEVISNAAIVAFGEDSARDIAYSVSYANLEHEPIVGDGVVASITFKVTKHSNDIQNDFGIKLSILEIFGVDDPDNLILTYDAPIAKSVQTTANGSLTSGTFTGLLPNEIYNIYALRSRTAAEPLSASNLLYIAQATSDAAGNLPYNCALLEDCPSPVIFCKAMHEFALGNAEITAADVTRDSITVKWEPYPGADMYRVYRMMNGIYILEGETVDTEYTVSGLSTGREYGFVVECRANGEWSYRAAEDVVYIQTEAEPEYMPGDVNSDGMVTLDDAVLTLQKAMKISMNEETFIEEAADVTGDGEITLDDAVAILKIAMKVTAT